MSDRAQCSARLADPLSVVRRIRHTRRGRLITGELLVVEIATYKPETSSLPFDLASAIGHRLRSAGYTERVVRACAPNRKTEDVLAEIGMYSIAIGAEQPCDETAVLTRLFLHGRSVADAHCGLVDPDLLALLVRAGFLASDGGRTTATVSITPYRNLLFVADRLVGESADGDATILTDDDFVMPPHATSFALLEHLTARAHGRFLDVGSGNGFIGQVLADRCQHVMGIDLNPRATRFAHFNAGLNGLDIEYTTADATSVGVRAIGEFDVIAFNSDTAPRHDSAFNAGPLLSAKQAVGLMAELSRTLLGPGGEAMLLLICERPADYASYTDLIHSYLPNGLTAEIEIGGGHVKSLSVSAADLHAGRINGRSVLVAGRNDRHLLIAALRGANIAEVAPVTMLIRRATSDRGLEESP
jgi:SAM-dependent methyltransferase